VRNETSTFSLLSAVAKVSKKVVASLEEVDMEGGFPFNKLF